MTVTERNRIVAAELSCKFVMATGKELEDQIFTELQIAQKRGEVLAKHRDGSSTITDCRLMNAETGRPVMDHAAAKKGAE